MTLKMDEREKTNMPYGKAFQTTELWCLQLWQTGEENETKCCLSG